MRNCDALPLLVLWLDLDRAQAMGKALISVQDTPAQLWYNGAYKQDTRGSWFSKRCKFNRENYKNQGGAQDHIKSPENMNF